VCDEYKELFIPRSVKTFVIISFKKGVEMASRFPLDVFHIAQPCRKSWDQMTGNSKTRFCDHCEKEVHDLSRRTQKEVDDLLASHSEGLCVRYSTASDGTIQTLDYESPQPVERDWSYWFSFSGLITVASGIMAIFALQACTVQGGIPPAPKPSPAGPSNPSGSANSILLGEIAPCDTAVTQPPTTQPAD